MLIRFDLDHAQFEEQHRWTLQHLSQGSELLRTVFSQPKSTRTLKDEEGLKSLGDQPHLAIFDMVIAKQQDEWEAPLRSNGVLPKLNTVINVKSGLESKLEARLNSMIDRKLADNYDENTYDSVQFNKDTLDLQVEFSQLREMQKLLNEMKMKKIDNHRRNI